MDRNEESMLYYRALIFKRLLSHRRFPESFLTDDIFINGIAGLVPERDFDFLLKKQEALEEGFGFRRNRGRGATARDREMARRVVARLLAGLDGFLGRCKTKRIEGAPFGRKIVEIRRVLKLDATETELLRFFALNETDALLKEVVEDSELEGMRKNYPHFLAHLLDLSPREVRLRIAYDGRLRKQGILESDDLVPNRFGSLELAEMVRKIIVSENVSPTKIIDCFYQREPEADLTAADYGHMEGDLAMVVRLLEDAWRKGRKGINILLYGPPGLGKTQLARLVAKLSGGNAYAVPRRDDDGDATSPSERRLAYGVFHRFCQGEHRPMLIVDEAEGMLEDSPLRMIFGGGNQQDDKKAWMTEALQENPLPVIWIVNRHYMIPPAVMRRFSYAVKFSRLNREVRLRIWRDNLREAGPRFQLSGAVLEELVETYDLSPGHIAQAVCTWRQVSGRRKPDPAALRQTLTQFHRLYHDEEPNTGKLKALDERYDPELLEIKGDLDAAGLAGMVETFYRLREQDTRKAPFQLTALLHGPPGCGKSELVKYLGRQCGRKVQVERMSDLMIPYIGETERAIAEAFHRAAQENNILLLDEFDSLGGDRGHAERSWEVSRTNELLQQIENFPGVLVCSTNLLDSLDPALARRFSVKLGFGGIRAEKRVAAVEDYFKAMLNGKTLNAPLRASIDGMKSLFPGDFRAVWARFQFDMLQGKTPTPETLVQALVNESKYRKETGSIGFRGNHDPKDKK